MKKTLVLPVLALGLSASLAGSAGGAATKLSCRSHAEHAGCPVPAGAVFSFAYPHNPGGGLHRGIVGVAASGPAHRRATGATLGENFAVPCTYLGVYNAHYRLAGRLVFGATLKVDASLHLRHTHDTQHARGTVKLGAKTAQAELSQTLTDQTGKVTCAQRLSLKLKRGRG